MPQKNVKRAYMICETPKALEALGVDEETARLFADKFSSVRLTEKTRAAIAAAAKAERTEESPEDGAILRSVLSDVIAERDAQAETERLLGEYGSTLGVYDAIMRGDGGFKLGSGVGMRTALCIMLHLRKPRAVRILTRGQAETYVNEILDCDEDKTYAITLDDDFTLKGVVSADGGEIFPQTLAEQIKTLGGRRIVLSRRTRIVTDEYFDLASAAETFCAELAEFGATLTDFMIFTPQGAAFINERADNGKPRFVFDPVLLPLSI